MGGFVIVSEIGSQITFIGDNLPIIKSDLLLKKPIPIFYVIVIWLEKVWLVHKSVELKIVNIWKWRIFPLKENLWEIGS